MSDQILDALGDAPVLFGLRAQGHIPTVEAMLCDGRSWHEIGHAIGWEGETAKRFYEMDRLPDAAIEVRRKPLAPPEIAGSACDYRDCTLDPVYEQDTPIGRTHFCGAHSDEMALDVAGVES